LILGIRGLRAVQNLEPKSLDSSHVLKAYRLNVGINQLNHKKLMHTLRR